MSRECYNHHCKKHNKYEPFCEEDRCNDTVDYKATFEKFSKLVNVLSVTKGEKSYMTMENLKLFIEESIVHKK